MNIKLYSRLDKIKFLSKSYTLKFLFIAFLGIHVPIIALVYFMFLTKIEITPTFALSLILIATLLSTVITMYILNGLLQPFKEAEKSLRRYVSEGVLPSFPLNYKDEIGSLFKNLQITLEKQDLLLKEKKDVIILLSHDLRSPLNKCLSLLSLIKSEDDEKEKKYYLSLVEDVISQQLDFLEDILLMLETQDNSPDKLSKTSVYLDEIVEKVVEALKFKIEEKRLIVETSFEKKEKVYVNEKLFYHALLNIMTNAIKFSYPDSSIHISEKSSDSKVILSIKDNGLGFEPEVSKELFKRFTNHKKAGTLGEKSTGLGLYITKQIIEKHQGEIEAYSEGKNKGSTFVINLPKV